MMTLLKELEWKWGVLYRQPGFRRAPALTAGRLISWRIRCLLRRTAVVNLSRWAIRLFLPVGWKGISKFMFVFREHYEPELAYLERILSRGKTFIDVGAAFGIYTLVASKLVGRTGRVIALEPTALSFEVLRQNIALNNLTNVLAFPVAMSLNRGRACLYLGPEPGSNSLGKDCSLKQATEEICTESLDNMVLQTSVGRVDAIKIDVEGAEELVLRGAEKTLTSMRPVVIFEVYPEAAVRLGLAPNGAWKLLERLGYELFVVGHGGMLCSVKVPPRRGSNVVAIHRGRQ
jgi:FkbM family methyltransferase